jgi:hypothetical protein
LEDYIMGGEQGHLFEESGLALSIRYSRLELPVPGLMDDDQDDCVFVVQEVVQTGAPTVELFVKQDVAESHEVPYLLKVCSRSLSPRSRNNL